MKRILVFLIVWWMCTSWATAGDIFVWTDAQGVKRYSDVPPATDSTKVQTIESVKDVDPSKTTLREEYRQMLQSVEEENRQSDLAKQQKAEAQAAERLKREQAEKEARTKAKQEELQKQIDAINNRAMSPTYTEGMRQNQKEAIQSSIDQLNASTDKKPNP